MSDILFKNLALLDPHAGVLKTGHQVLIRGNRIAEVRKGIITAKGAAEIDLGGRTLMPGLIDCHVHVCSEAGMSAYPKLLPSMVTAHAGIFLRDMLQCGFTAARDVGGADLGHKQAVERGLFVGPRLFVAGRAISQTGGHGDGRSRADLNDACGCAYLAGGIGRIADGVDAVRRAVRDEIRLGADQIKIMAGGGVGSAADPLDQLQYSDAEILAAVDEATRSHTYVAAHVYNAEGIARAVELGVRTIEHGNFIDERGAKLMAARGAYLVPTLITYRALVRHGKERGMAEESLAKAREVLASGTRSLEIAKAAGVKMAYGSDLFVSPKIYQPEEFLVRAEVLSAAEIIRSATVIGAEVLRQEGQLGVIAPGALADLLVVDGDPFADLGLFQHAGRHLSVIMKDGAFFKNTLAR